MSDKTKTKTGKPAKAPAVIKYVEGNLFENIKGLSNITIPHVCNDVGLWGSGFVIPLGRYFPKAQQEYLAWYKDEKIGASTLRGVGFAPARFALGETLMVKVDEKNNIWVANMIAQHNVGGGRPLRYNALVKCMETVVSLPAPPEEISIHAPLFGSQLAGGKWEFIAELIQDIWVDRGFNVTIHYLPGQLPQGFGS